MSKIILSAENKSIYLDTELNCSRLATLLERVNNKTFKVFLAAPNVLEFFISIGAAFQMWSPLVRRHLSYHLLWYILMPQARFQPPR